MKATYNTVKMGNKQAHSAKLNTSLFKYIITATELNEGVIIETNKGVLTFTNI